MPKRRQSKRAETRTPSRVTKPSEDNPAQEESTQAPSPEQPDLPPLWVKREVVDHGIYVDENNYYADDEQLLAHIDAPLERAESPYIPIVGSDIEAEMAGAMRSIEAELAQPTNERSRGAASSAETYLRELREWLDKGNTRKAAFYGFLLGKAMEQLTVRRLEHFALTGKKRRRASEAGGRATKRLTPEEEQRCCELMREEMLNRVSKSAASRRVAPKLSKELNKELGRELSKEEEKDISPKTVLRTWDAHVKSTGQGGSKTDHA